MATSLQHFLTLVQACSADTQLQNSTIATMVQYTNTAFVNSLNNTIRHQILGNKTQREAYPEVLGMWAAAVTMKGNFNSTLNQAQQALRADAAFWRDSLIF